MSDPEESVPFLPGSGSRNEALHFAVIVFISIALYNAFELAVLIPLYFHRRRSLYFWALLTSTTLGVIPATIGPSLQFFGLAPLWLDLVLSNVGFVMMVPNQSIVLYSRLHLVSQNTLILNCVRRLIYLGFIVVAVPTIILNFGASYRPQSTAWVPGFEAIERIQLTWFSVQECVISTVYIWETVQMIKLSSAEDRRQRKILYELLAINVTAITMDLSLVILQYLGFYFTQVILKATVYSMKLKMESAVLSMLVSMVHSHHSEGEFWHAN